MPRLCILTQYYPPEIGAPQARLSELAVRLVRRGWEVEVLTALPNYPTGRILDGYPSLRPTAETIDGIRVNRVPLIPSSRGFAKRVVTYFSFAGSARLLGPRLLQRPDLLYVESPPLFIALAARSLARRWRCPYVLNVSDLWPQSAIEMGVIREGVAAKAGRRLERWAYDGAAGLTGQSELIVEAIRETVPDRPTAVITNGVDPARFHPTPRPDDGPVRFVYAGLLGHAQGLDQILDLVAVLPTESPARFVLVGDGPMRGHIRRRIAQEHLDRVELLPPVTSGEMPALLADADAAVVTLGADLRGAVPSKIYEAMAAGLPILLVATGEAASRVDEASCGLVVPQGDITALLSAVDALTSSPDLRRRLGAKGREAAETAYDRDRIAGELDRFLSSALAGEVHGRGDGVAERSPTDVVARHRLETVYQRYAEDPRKQAGWDPDNRGNQLIRARLVERADELMEPHLPRSERHSCRVLEVGCGEGRTLASMPDIGFDPSSLFGVDLLAGRLDDRDRDIRLVAADGARLPFPDASFEIVVTSTLFSSILSDAAASRVAHELVRVMRTGGVLLWYDLRLPNPVNRAVRPYSRRKIRGLFPELTGHLGTTTVLPQLARRLGGATDRLYPRLERLRPFNSHNLGVLVKPS